MSFRSVLRIAATAALCLAAALPARAQLDPRLQDNTPGPDLLDVYKVVPAEPEMLMVFDFSGSMHAVYWDKRYYTGQNEDTHGSRTNASSDWNSAYPNNDPFYDFPGIVPVLDRYGYIHMFQGTGYDQSLYGLTQSSNFAAYDDATYGARLIAPNGTVVLVPDGKKTFTQAQLLTYVEQASHIRVTATATVTVNGSSQKVTRQVDLPIPWAIFDWKNATASSALNAIYMVADPGKKDGTTSPGPSVTPDAVGINYDGTIKNSLVENILNSSPNWSAVSYYKIGRFHYNPDFLWWIFFGTDTKVKVGNDYTSQDTGKFVIPAYYDSQGSASEPSGYPATTWANGLYGMTRYQALKRAVIEAWFKNQGYVWWAYRYLDGAEELLNTVSSSNGNSSATMVSRDVRLFGAASSGTTPNSQVMNFLGAAPSTSTPLTYAFANAYAQLSVPGDSGDAWSTLGKGTSSNGIPNGQSGTQPEPIDPCRKTFVVVFTDGIANDGYQSNQDGSAIGTWDPYSAGTDVKGNGIIYTPKSTDNRSALNPSTASSLGASRSMFNIYTLAGLAAHYPWATSSDYFSGTLLDTSSNNKARLVAPFPITSRGATTSSPRHIRTMTVGLSLGGNLSDTGINGVNGKKDLYRAALYGNPDLTTWNLSTPPYDPNDSNTNPKDNPFFFDAQDVDTLSGAMTAILAEVTAGSASIAAPASPLVGLSLGNQVYLGLFQTVDGPRWKGDLLMAGLYLGSQGVSFIQVDSTGAASPATNITDQNAVWSVYRDVFKAAGGRTWKSRNIYTNLPGTGTLVPFDESNLTITNAMVGAPDSTTRTAYIRFMRGAEKAAETDSTDTTPRDDIMGDIIDSSPQVLEYPLSALTSAVSPTLASHLSEPPDPTKAHFRVIFVGDNQGIFHAFGELSWTTTGTLTFTTTDASGNTTTTTVNAQVPHGYVDELWAFIPGEYLQYISQLRGTANPHRYMVDGTPLIYFKDVPGTGQTTGDGIVDGSDVVRVIIGERKGGRSYYAFDFSNLGNITMPWRLVPDEIPTTTTDGNLKVMARMGYSTCNPAVGRVNTTLSSSPVDLVFLGGGLSTQTIDSNFAATYGSGTKLGRSLVAFDVVNGPLTSLYTWDFTSSAFTSTFGAMGCVPAGVVPFEYFSGSRQAQRVYFADTPTAPNTSATRGGGVWALGSNALATNGVIRLDSGSIDDWVASTNQGIRKIAQAPVGWSVTTTPTPFLLGSPYPVARTITPVTMPAAVGIAFGTGDRNDPMDNDGINPAITTSTKTTPYNNWMNVVFDRQDSASISGVSGVATTNLDPVGIKIGILSSAGDVADLTTVNSFTGTVSVGGSTYSVDPTNSAFYLKQKLGYKLNLGAAVAKSSSGYYYPKVITNSQVLNGVLFFSSFTPKSSTGTTACSGTGFTNTYRICNVLEPTFNSGSTIASSNSFNGGDPTCTGVVLTFPNLPGELTSLGTTAVIQSGQGNSTPGQVSTIDNSGAKVGGSVGKTSSFAFKPRSWRIVR